MKKVKNKLLNVTAPLAAIVAISISYSESRCPCLSQKDCMILAANFKFDKMPLAEVPNHPPYKYVRQVHPSLQRISAWISSLGASVAMADLDGDGLPNDMITLTRAPTSSRSRRYREREIVTRHSR